MHIYGVRLLHHQCSNLGEDGDLLRVHVLSYVCRV